MRGVSISKRAFKSITPAPCGTIRAEAADMMLAAAFNPRPVAPAARACIRLHLNGPRLVATAATA